MKKRAPHLRFISSILIVFCSVLGGQEALAGPLDEETRKSTLIIAKVGDNPKKVYPRLKSLADYLASRLQDQGISRGEVLIAENNQTMENWIKRGEVDLVTETPFSATYLQFKTGAEPLTTGWRKGVPSYHSVIFVHKDSDIHSLDDLVGKRIAFEDPGSTSAYYLPVSSLLNQGFTMTRLDSVRDRVEDDEIGYVFSEEEINSTTWVHKGLVDAAALSNLDWDSDESVPSVMRKDLRIIFETNTVPRSVELFQPQRGEAFKARLREELLRAHEIPEGQAAIQKYKSTTKFTAIDEQTSRAFDEIAVLMKAVRSELEF